MLIMKLKNTEILQFRKDSKFKLKLIKKADKTWIYLTFYKTGTQLDMGGEKITNLATPHQTLMQQQKSLLMMK